MARNHGVNRKLLAERIGHKNQTVTDTVYTHPTIGADRPVAETIGEVIKNAVERAASRKAVAQVANQLPDA